MSKPDKRIKAGKGAGATRRRGTRLSPLGRRLLQGAKEILAYQRGELHLKTRHVQVERTSTGETVSPYSMVIEWESDDGLFVVSVPELPGLHTYGATYEEAARKGAAFLEEWIGVLAAAGQDLPPVREWRPKCRCLSR